MEDVTGARRPDRLGAVARWWLAVVGWAAMIFWFSSHTGSQLPRHWLLSHDKLCHGAEYALLGGLLCLAVWRSGLPGVKAVALATLLGGLYGASDEFHQGFVPGRQGNDPFDLLADVAGSALGGAVVAVVLLRSRIPTPPPPEETLA